MYHEWKRVLLQRRFWTALLLIFIGNALLFFLVRVEVLDLSATPLRQAYLSDYLSGAVTEEELSRRQSEAETLLYLFTYAGERQTDPASYDIFYAGAEAALREACPELAQAFDRGDYQEKDIQCTYMALEQVLETIRTADSYRSYVTGVLERAEQMQSMSIFDTTETQQATIAATRSVFGNLPMLEVTPGNDLPLTKATGYDLEYLFGIAALFVLVQKLEEEKRWEMRPVLYAAARGRFRLSFRRSVLLAAGSAIIAAILSLSTLASACWVYGRLELSRLVQSVPVFYDFTWVMTIGQFLLLRCGMLALNLAVLGACLWLLRSLFRDERIAVVLFAGLLGLSALCYRVIPLLSGVGWLKYINLYAGIAWAEYGLSYYALPFLWTLPERFSFAVMVQGVFLAGMLSGATAVNTRKRPIATPQRWTERFAQCLDHLSQAWHTQVGKLSYRGLEWYRLGVTHKGIAVAAVFVSLLVQLYPFQTAVLTGKERILNDYYRSAGGALTSETDSRLREMEEAFAEADASLEESRLQYDAGLLDLETYQQAVSRYDAFAAQREAYEELSRQVQYLKEQQEAGYDVWVIDPAGYAAALEGHDSNDRTAWLLLLTVLLWLAWTLNADRYNKSAFTLLGTTENGTQRLGRLKTCQAVICLTALYALFTAIKLAAVQTANGLDALTAPAHSLELFASLPINPPLWVMLLLWYTLRLLPCLALMGAFCALSASPLGSAGLLLAGACKLLPDVLSLLGYEVLQDWAIWNLAKSCAQALVCQENWIQVGLWLLLWLGAGVLNAYFWKEERVWNCAAKRYGKITAR